MSKNISLYASAVLVWLTKNEKPKLGVAPRVPSELHAFWSFVEAVKWLRENEAPEGKVAWILTSDQLLGPTDIEEIDAGMGDLDEALDRARRT